MKLKENKAIIVTLLLGCFILYSGKKLVTADSVNNSESNNSNYYQQTPSFTNPLGKISLNYYSQSDLARLTAITHNGNMSLDKVSTDHIYANGDNIPYPSFVGTDGVLELYNESNLMTNKMLDDAAGYWNRLAGVTIVKRVNSQSESDEVIHDSDLEFPNNPILGGQSYTGEGIVFYTKSWQTDSLNWKEATLIHEIGHALGIPHLGGGADGEDGNIHEFMSIWNPYDNPEGITSTEVDTAALALAGLSWENPVKLSSWVLTQPEAYVNYDNGVITYSGTEISFKGNYLETKTDVCATATVKEVYDVHQVNPDGFGTTLENSPSLNNYLGQTLKVIAVYTTSDGGDYYDVIINGKEYLVSAAAFYGYGDYKGVEIDFSGNYLNVKTAVNGVATVLKSYNVYRFTPDGLALTLNETPDLTNYIGQNLQVVAKYTSTRGLDYYVVVIGGKEYVVNSAAFDVKF